MERKSEESEPRPIVAANAGMDIEEIAEHPEKSSALGLIKKLIFISPLLLVILVIAYSSPLSEYFRQVPELSAKIRQTGYLAPLIFTLGIAILIAIGFPRLVFCPLAGMVFGFSMGLIWVMIGTIAAYYLVFIFVHKGGGVLFKKRFSEAGKISGIIKKGGIPAVILARQIPVHGMAVNIFLGLSKVSHRDYLIGTAIGIIPETIPCVLLGTSAAQGSLMKSIAYLVVAVLVLAFLWLGLICYANYGKSRINAET